MGALGIFLVFVICLFVCDNFAQVTVGTLLAVFCPWALWLFVIYMILC